MTIIYQYRVASTSLGGFLKLLKAWRGSVYKLLYKETFIFCALYTAISLTYRFALNPQQKQRMEQVVIHCNSYTSFIPISFVLGFYVTVIVQRWWQQFRNVPWPDRTLFVMCTYLCGEEERSRIMRRAVARYLLFGLLLIMRSVSLAVMKRFPTIDTIVEAGFISKKEAEMYEAVQCRYLKFWVPIMWANNVLARARREGRIETEFGLRMVLEQLADFRDKCSLCFVYDWITIPLVYTQVVTLAVYSFFAACLLGRQFLDSSKGYPGYEYDSYVPVFTLLQFTFYMGWLKVAEQMINPFGEDDDDFDINWLLDRHMAVAFALVDQCCRTHPPLVRDQFYEEAVMPEMPYTVASASSRRPNFLGSSFNINHLASEDPKHPGSVDTEGLRRRSHGSFAGSVLSLFPFRAHNRLLSGSRDTIDSGEHPGRVVANKGGYLQVPQVAPSNDKSRSISLDMSNDETIRLGIPDYRERSFSDRVSTTSEADTPVRKKSSPHRFNFLLTRDTSHPASPKPPRFVVEPVADDNDVSGGERSRRGGQHVLSMLQGAPPGGNKAVSRPPLLSAIEEGNTVTSIRQLLPRSDSDDTASVTSADDVTEEVKDAKGLDDITEDHRELEFIDDHHVTTATDHVTMATDPMTSRPERAVPVQAPLPSIVEDSDAPPSADDKDPAPHMPNGNVLDMSWTVGTAPPGGASMTSRFPRRPSRGALVMPNPELLLSSASRTSESSASSDPGDLTSSNQTVSGTVSTDQCAVSPPSGLRVPLISVTSESDDEELVDPFLSPVAVGSAPQFSH
ncbi:bestrophin-2-like [Babylonia areolata]|uniref:bestrophin-2-like n=1 Tax=Babylonia areolata TaxID=304850 RepID=UPI003FD2382E